MNRIEILKFIAENQNEQLLDFYNKSYEKLSDLNKQIDRLSLYLIITVFLYFIASSTTIASIQIGPATITDISLLLKIIPVLFAFLMFQIVVISSQKAELFTVVKMLFLANYKQEVDFKQLDNYKNNDLTRLLLPFSYSTELTKFNAKKPGLLNSCIGAILILPVFAIVFLPLYFEIYMLKVIWQHYYTQTFAKISFWLSIWITTYMVYYLVANSIENYKQNKTELT
ncbi:hypothetical protein HRG84_04965 [Flavisolibacter sp. BT320]|nr:hypothetical protein [Flavisolibacter longurius]